MAGSRLFSVAADVWTASLGGANLTAARTQVIVAKIVNHSGATKNLLKPTSDNSTFFARDGTPSETAIWSGGTEYFASPPSWDDSVWMLSGVTKAAGAAIPQAFKYVFSTGVASNAAMGIATMADTTVTGTWSIDGGNGNGTNTAILVACAAIAKTAFSVAQLTALKNYPAFLVAGFDEVWPFDGAGPFNGTGTSTQSSLSGTTHSTEEPEGFWRVPPIVKPNMGQIAAVLRSRNY